MNNGFIYLHRKLKDHWIWKNPFYFQWFVYFLFRANYKDNKVLIGSDLVDVKKGQFITSIDNLTKDLNGATNQKVRTFLKLLEKDHMIIKKSTSKLTKITICNYDTYQTNQQTNNKPITNEQQTNNKPITTENKDNNKEIKNNNINKRKQVFKTQINEILKSERSKYKNFKQDIIDFFEYWSEHGLKDKKMRFEKEKSFGIPRRLDTWFKNKEKFKPKTHIQKDQSDFNKIDKGWN